MLTICIYVFQNCMIQYFGSWGNMRIREGTCRDATVTVGSDCHIANGMHHFIVSSPVILNAVIKPIRAIFLKKMLPGKLWHLRCKIQFCFGLSNHNQWHDGDGNLYNHRRFKLEFWLGMHKKKLKTGFKQSLLVAITNQKCYCYACSGVWRMPKHCLTTWLCW